MSLPALAPLILDVLVLRADEDKYVNTPPEKPGEPWERQAALEALWSDLTIGSVYKTFSKQKNRL